MLSRNTHMSRMKMRPLAFHGRVTAAGFGREMGAAEANRYRRRRTFCFFQL